MADFFIVTEIIKYFELENAKLMVYYPFVWMSKMRTDRGFSSYFMTIYGAVDETAKESLNIKGVRVGLTDKYDLQDSLANCLTNESSFYFDIVEQILYIHFEHDTNPMANIVEYGKIYGYTNDKVRIFNDIEYLPLIESIPNTENVIDPLKYNSMSFYPGNIILKNYSINGSNNGPFDNNLQFSGNEIFVFCGMDNYTYAELLLITSNYIYNTVITPEKINIKTKDIRELESLPVPIDTFNDTEFPDIDPDIIGDIKPDAYGFLKNIPGICINSEQTGNKTFYFASEIHYGFPYSIPDFRVWKDNDWFGVFPTVTDYSNGMATFNVIDVHVDGDNTKGLYKLVCTATFRSEENPGDIIADMLDRFAGIPYNTSNYDITEWADEKQYLEDVGLYLDKQRELYEWIKLLQGGSTVGFQYFFYNGKRTMRLDNPNRDSSATIAAVNILNRLSFENNEDFYATQAVINYNQDHSNNKYFRYENADYFETVFLQHKRIKQYETNSLLAAESEADDKSVIIMEDLRKERKTGWLSFWGIGYYALRLFDIIDVECSLPGQKIGKTEIDTITVVDTAADTIVVTDSDTDDSIVVIDYTYQDIIINYREFLGWQRFQVIGLKPDYASGRIDIKVRQRDYSDEFDTITGYSP